MFDKEPWLLAVWPGMGSVAQLAGTYLAEELGADRILEFDPGRHFDISAVEVEDGVLQIPHFPKSTLYGWRNPGKGRDLLIMVGESQPDANGFEFCLKLLDTAANYGVTRVVTLAASLAKLGPDDRPGISAAVTHARLLDPLSKLAIAGMDRGHITGLNGVFLGAAKTRDLEGICLLGEIPFYAAPLPIPKTSYTLLETFGKLAGLELPLERLHTQMQHSRATIEAIFRTYEQAAMASSGPPLEAADEEPVPEPPPAFPEPSPEALERIEQLFGEAGRDREKALELKRELDSWGIFKKYEDRFLDLFTKGDS